jgi:class 3 adenylate cyclase
VTVLFADLVGFTAKSETLDLENASYFGKWERAALAVLDKRWDEAGFDVR